MNWEVVLIKKSLTQNPPVEDGLVDTCKMTISEKCEKSFVLQAEIIKRFCYDCSKLS